MRYCWLIIFAICGVAAAIPPKVVKSSPENGQDEVDPGATEIRVEFDQPMNHGGRSIVGGGERFPEITAMKWADTKTMVIEVKLQPQHDYHLSINSDTFKNFRGTNGESAEWYPISFKTRAAGAATQPAKVLTAEENRAALAKLQNAIDNDYGYRDRLGIDWAKEFSARHDEFEKAKTPNEFARRCANLLRLAEDPHVSVQAGETRIHTKANSRPPNFNWQTLQRLVPEWKENAAGIVTGKFPGEIAYVLIPTWTDEQADVFDKLFDDLSSAKAMIIDVRANGGGDEIAARRVASYFVSEPSVYSKDRIREAGSWKGPHDRIIKPRGDGKRFLNPVAILIGSKVMSSNESFVLMMKHGAKATLIGDTTCGSSGRPMAHDLGNGVTAYLPSWEDQLPDGTVLEGKGVAPDLEVKTDLQQLAKRDPVLDDALKFLGETR